MNKRGHFFVIDGTDGSGKATQIQLLKEYFKKNKIACEVVDFPRYQHNVYGRMVGRYLKGDFGTFDDVNPYLASLMYAGDRLLAKPLLEKWLAQGKVVIANRYVSSNKAFMGAKLPKSKRNAFINWIDNMEYKTNGIPREELVIFLYVPAAIGQQNVDKKGSRLYLKGERRDIHEDNLTYQQEAGKMYMKMVKDEEGWVAVNCVNGEEMRSREEIHQEIVAILKEKKIA
jgi:dTMP kinase